MLLHNDIFINYASLISSHDTRNFSTVKVAHSPLENYVTHSTVYAKLTYYS